MMKEMETDGLWPSPIVTELVPLDAFYAAEDYHQRYYEQNSRQPYCTFVIAPKLAKLRKEALALLSSTSSSPSTP